MVQLCPLQTPSHYKANNFFFFLINPFTAQLCLVNEYVARGDMLRILRRCRSRRKDQPPYSPTPVEELLSFACDITQGMRHITLLKVKLILYLKYLLQYDIINLILSLRRICKRFFLSVTTFKPFGSESTHKITLVCIVLLPWFYIFLFTFCFVIAVCAHEPVC